LRAQALAGGERPDSSGRSEVQILSGAHMNLVKLERILKDTHQPKFRLEQIKGAVYRDGISSFLDISTIPKELREKLDKEIKILSFEVEKVLVSEDKKSVKALLKLSDGEKIETVLLSSCPARLASMSGLRESRLRVWTVCISSQVGCPLNCAFCATGKSGFKRNLTAEEIINQVLFWRQYLNKNPSLILPLKKEEKIKISNIVYMGMGEPMLNLENVKQSLRDLVDPKLFGFGSRSISVSTAGIPEKLKEFSEEFPQINLAISLHFTDNETRDRFMPINKKYNLDKLRIAIKEYFQKNKRKIFLEYIMFEGLNDNLKDAEKLIAYLKSIGNVYLLHVNLISYNKTSNNFKPSSGNTIIKFRNYLLQNKINVTIRKSLGQDICGACGQLKGL
jgi:23S rRNA (adenine2503-C2)-methyltransferase